MEDCSRKSTQHYKSAPENLSEIARQLGVAHILEGSVQKTTSCASTSSYSKRPMMRAPTRLSVISNVAGRKLNARGDSAHAVRWPRARCVGLIAWIDSLNADANFL